MLLRKMKGFSPNQHNISSALKSFSCRKISLFELNKCLLHLSPYCVNPCNVYHPIMMPWKNCNVHLIPQDLVINWCCRVNIKPWRLTTLAKRWMMGLFPTFASSLLNSKFALLSNNRLEISFLTYGFRNSSVSKFMFNLQV